MTMKQNAELAMAQTIDRNREPWRSRRLDFYYTNRVSQTGGCLGADVATCVATLCQRRVCEPRICANSSGAPQRPYCGVQRLNPAFMGSFQCPLLALSGHSGSLISALTQSRPTR